MFYVVRYNAALAALGIDPLRVNAEMRMFAQRVGSQLGLTPQEAVLVTLTQMPLDEQFEMNPALVQVWVDDGKVSLEKDDIKRALSRLGWVMFPRR